MSHAYVFQLEKSPRKFNLENGIKRWLDVLDNGEEILCEYDLDIHNFPHASWVEHFGDSQNSPEDNFESLLANLPKGCFEVDKDKLSIKLVNRPTEYVTAYINNIKEQANTLSLENYLSAERDLFWPLEKLMMNNCNYDLVYMLKNGYPIDFHQWLIELAKYGEIGATWYMGGVLNYHY